MLFFLSYNFLITLLTLLFNRYSQQDIYTKLSFTIFSLISWLLPLNLIREHFTTIPTIKIPWHLSTTQISPAILEPKAPHWVEIISPTHIFIIASLFGFCLFIFRIFKHTFWLKNLKNDKTTKLISNYFEVPVYASNLIPTAIVSGYRKPTIWLNTKLINSPLLDAILCHETTHIKYKDNYLIIVMTFIKSIYWWNPLTYKLITIIEELIEARCDHKSSKSFAEGIYQKKLAQLMFFNKPVTKTGLVSAATSRNSNIRRLKLLKEEQYMKLSSRLVITTVMTTIVAVLTLPIFTFKATASHLMTDKGVLIDLEINKTILKITSENDKTESRWESEAQLWTSFSKKAAISSKDMWHLEFEPTHNNNLITMNFTIFNFVENKMVEIAKPRLIVKPDQTASFTVNDKNLSFEVTFTAKLSENPNDET